MTKKSLILVLALLSMEIRAQINYPTTRTEPFDTLIYNKKLSDPFFWMSRKANEQEMKRWVSEQGKLTQSVLDSIPGTDVLVGEIETAYMSMQDEVWDLKVVNNQFYYHRDIPGKGSSLCRRKTMDAEEEIIFSGAITVKGQKYKSRKVVYAHSQPYAAMMLTQRGEANPHIRIYDLTKKRIFSRQYWSGYV